MRYGISPSAYWPIDYFPRFTGGTYTLNAGGGSYTETVSDVNLLASLVLSANSGHFIETGYSVDLDYTTPTHYVLTADPGIYIYTGYDVELTYDQWILLKYTDIPVYKTENSVPLYWGALTTAPSSGYIVDDYYFDANTAGSGGGIIRYYNGSSWVEMTSSHPLYVEANWNALSDMCEWATDQATTIAAATAIVQKLVTSDAFIENLYAQNITVPSGGSQRWYDGQGVNRTSIRLEDGRLDFLDSPDTTPATDEVLRARFGRLGVNGPSILDGYIYTNIENGWFDSGAIPGASDTTYRIISVKRANGSIRVAYKKSDNKIYERTFSTSTLAFGTETTLVDEAVGNFKYGETKEGVLHFLYGDTTGTPVYHEMIYNDSTSSWGSSATIGISASTYGSPGYLASFDGNFYLYLNNSSTLDVYKTTYSGGSWGTPVLDLSKDDDGCFVFERNNNERWMFHYGDGGTYTYIKKREYNFSTNTWGSAVTVNSYMSSTSIYETIDDTLLVYCPSGGGSAYGYTYDDVNDVFVSIETLSGTKDYPSIVQSSDGTIYMFYINSSDLPSLRYKISYAPIMPRLIEQSYIPAPVGFGTPSDVSFSWVRIGNKCKVLGRFTPGTTTATEARLPLPWGLTIDSTLVPSIRSCGRALRSTSGVSGRSVLMLGGNSYVTFSLINATGFGALTSQNGSDVAVSGEVFSVEFEVPVTGWNT